MGVLSSSSVVADSPKKDASPSLLNTPSFFQRAEDIALSNTKKVSLAGTPRPDSDRDSSNAQMTLAGMIDMAFYFEQECSPFSTIVTNLVNDTFRNGFEWKAKFVSKCLKCGKEWQDSIDECDCGSQSFREPDVHQQEFFRRPDGTSFFDCVNDANMSLLSLCKLAQRHRTVADNQYWILQRAYLMNNVTGEYESALTGIYPIDPRDIEKVFDLHGHLGNNDRICLEHREPSSSTVCRKCGMPTYPVAYRTRLGKPIHYAEHEVIHTMLYNPGLIYGYPEIIRASNIVNAIINIDWRMRDYYENVNLPMLIGITSQSQETLQQNIRKLVEQKKQFPSLPSFISMGENGKMESIKLMDDPNKDMWELRRMAVLDIAARFGFPPILLNDMTGTGGLSVQSEQNKNYDAVIEMLRSEFDTNDLRPLIDGFPYLTDWELIVKRENDDDTNTELDVMLKQAQVMQTLSNLGFDVEYRNKEIIVSDTIQHEPVQPMMFGREANFGNNTAHREPIISEDERMTYFLKSLYSRDALKERKDVVTALAMAQSLTQTLIKSIPQSEIPKLYDSLITLMTAEEGWTMNQAIDMVAQRFGLDKPTAQTIARTETRRIATAVKEVETRANDPADAVYRWVGANDRRTTDACRKVKQMIDAEGGAVTLDRLEEITRTVGEEWFASRGLTGPSVPFEVHINCRHTWVRWWK